MTPRGIRNNNPGNLDFNRRNFNRDPWVGETGPEIRGDGSEGRFTNFDSPEHGIRALAKVLLTYCRLRKAADGSPIDTVQEIIDRWAPPHENDTTSYARHVRAQLDLEEGENVDVTEVDVLEDLVTSIIAHENGVQPYSEEVIAEGVRLALA
jgi:hypothetical protein